MTPDPREAPAHVARYLAARDKNRASRAELVGEGRADLIMLHPDGDELIPLLEGHLRALLDLLAEAERRLAEGGTDAAR